MHTPYFLTCLTAMGLMLGAACSAPPTPQTPPETPAETDLGPRAVYPGVVLDRRRGHVDLRGHVVGREVEWLELLACRPGTREYESVVALDAQATHIQLGLILLGLEPGTPSRAQKIDGQTVILPPEGPALELFFVLDDQPDREIPAAQWVVHQDTGEAMPDNRWLFLGSRRVQHEDNDWFLAEENGTLVSLVNFGDELIGRPTEQSEAGGNVFWTAHTPEIPALGTPVTLRVRPVTAAPTTPP